MVLCAAARGASDESRSSGNGYAGTRRNVRCAISAIAPGLRPQWQRRPDLGRMQKMAHHVSVIQSSEARLLDGLRPPSSGRD
jgi:hypothetical protein